MWKQISGYIFPDYSMSYTKPRIGFMAYGFKNKTNFYIIDGYVILQDVYEKFLKDNGIDINNLTEDDIVFININVAKIKYV